MTDVAVDTLRLRGPQARRLLSVAAGPLAPALERALADVGDVVLDRVEVRLDVDVDAYDDVTLAVLWADAIRAGVLAAGASVRLPPGPPAPRRAGSPRALQGTAGLLAVARAWLAADGPRLPRELLALGDPATARAVAASAGPEEWSRLMALLARRLGLPTRAHGTTDPSPTGPPEGRSGLPDADRRRAPEPSAGSLPPAVPARTGSRDGHRRESAPAVQRDLAELAELVDAAAADLDPAAVTRAAGLVLLYPWLADHCRRAEDLHPRLDPMDVREAALGALVDDDLRAVDDVLVALLAGRSQPTSDRARLPLPAQDVVAQSAAGVLRSFATLLPGFEESSPAFVRESWIARIGVLDAGRDPALLTATTHPLDVMLPLLPYPLGLVKLPWSPPVSVRFRP